MERRLKEKVAEALAGILEPNEPLLIGSNGFHPRLTTGIGFYLTILVGATTGSLLQSAFGWGTVALTPAFGVGLALLARWIHLFRTRSTTQPAGAVPLIGLTNARLVFIETDFWGRPSGERQEISISEIDSLQVRKRLLSLPNAVLHTTDDRVIHYQIRYADRIRDEIEKLQATR